MSLPANFPSIFPYPIPFPCYNDIFPKVTTPNIFRFYYISDNLFSYCNISTLLLTFGFSSSVLYIWILYILFFKSSKSSSVGYRINACLLGTFLYAIKWQEHQDGYNEKSN